MYNAIATEPFFVLRLVVSLRLAYDAQGRITSQRRGANAKNNWGGEYSYYAKTNKLEKVANGMGGESANNRNMSASGNFVYDSEGNIIEDKSKSLKISYDWRGMPVEFLHETGDNSKDYKLLMAYDGSGRRVSKTRYAKHDQFGYWTRNVVTHYTGIGTEVREAMRRSASPKTTVVVNLPQGLGRYLPEDAEKAAGTAIPLDKDGKPVYVGEMTPEFEWYLKNHLGSTMLVYGTQPYNDKYSSYAGGVKAAYDYRAFGEQVSLAEPTDKVTENFTGKGVRGERCGHACMYIAEPKGLGAKRKENDDETELNYFGARYLDPMLGMWTSVDAARQYDSPYTYAGNNPIIVTDPDGLWGFSASVGIKGAVIAGGLFNLSINYDSERPEANKVMLTVGYGVGIDVGLTKLKFKMFNKALSKVEPVNASPSDKDPETGWHSQIDASLGIIPIQGSFKDEATTPSSYGLGVGGGYYDTYTVDLGKFFNDKTETIRNETLEDQADINNIDLDSN